MPRRLRVDLGGIAYHVLNRRAGRATLFEKNEDYTSFVNVMAQASGRVPMRVVAYCLMPNHWHLVVWPRRDGDLARYMQWLTTTHMRRWHAHHGTRGTGPLYQGRYKSFPMQDDRHFLIVCRYVERNPLRANLVERAEAWPWSSLSSRRGPDRCDWLLPIGDWPVTAPRNWQGFVNRPETEEELEALRQSVARGSPYGHGDWQKRTALRLGLESSLHDPWRPRKPVNQKK